MSRYDNPFDTEDNNPFSETAAGRGKNAAPAPSLGGQYATGSFYDTNKGGSSASKPIPLPHETIGSTTIDVQDEIPLGNNSKDLKRKEKELKAKEAALTRKEQELRQREQAVGIDHKNWPPCFPLIHHDIANDIPGHLQAIQRAAYWSWLGIMWCLFYNIVGVTAAWAGNAVNGGKGMGNFFLSIGYALAGWSLAYFLWYKRLYNAMRKDSAFTFAFFFVFYLVHVAFCIFASIAPPFLFKGKSLCGVYASVEIFSDGHTVIGIIFVIGAAFFILESFLSLWVLSQVYSYFRGAGKSSQMRGEVAMSAVTGRY